MEASLKLGNGDWGVKNDSLLAYDDVGGKFRPLPFDFTRASSATVVNKQGLIETVQSGIPRIDFSDDANGALKLEPQSTNLITYSEDFSNSSWTKLNGATVTADTIISPDGTLNADSFTFTTSPSDKLQKVVTVAPSVKYTVSCYIKSDSNITIKMGGATAASPINVTTEWVRHTITQTNSATTTAYPQITSNGTAGTVYIYGFQLEQSSYATSYIPTQGAISTRVADSANGAGNSTVINSTEGVLYAEISALADDGTFRLLSFSDGTSVNRVYIGYSSVDKITCSFQIASSPVYGFDFTTDINVNSKLALKYKENDFALWVNGVEVNSQSSGNTFPIGTLTKMQFTSGTVSSPFYGNTKGLKYYPKALADVQLEDLTTI